MIFFKFNLISFTVTILAVLIIPAYSITPENCNAYCKYMLTNYAGFNGQRAYDQNHKNYIEIMEQKDKDDDQMVKGTVDANLFTIYQSLKITDSKVAASQAFKKKIFKNLTDGYYNSLSQGLQLVTQGCVELYCGKICNNTYNVLKNYFTHIQNQPFVYRPEKQVESRKRKLNT
uniref:Uncharacterized protein n=1 Tax=Schizaphis graminum TaxID=13262 RepID=A0A2S2NAW5_SCHGA